MPEVSSTSSQTNWLLKRNKITQYEPRTTPLPACTTATATTSTSIPSSLSSTRRNSRAGTVESGSRTKPSAENCGQNTETAHLGAFISNVASAMFTALEENTVLELFREDYELLQSNTTEPVLAGKAANVIKEYQSYRYGDEGAYSVTSMDWHPMFHSVFAMASTRRQNYDERLVSSMAAVSAVVSVWQLRNPIQPLLLLHAPDDVFSVAFCPSDANLIVGGCVNGQVVLWDLAHHAHVLQAAHGGGSSSSAGTESGGSSGAATNGKSIPLVYPTALSSIEHSHQSSISQVGSPFQQAALRVSMVVQKEFSTWTCMSTVAQVCTLLLFFLHCCCCL